MEINNLEITAKTMKQKFNKKSICKLNNMKKIYKETENIKNNPLVYTVYKRDFGLFKVGLTTIEPGNINKEFFMTKGHKHRKPRKEIYIMLNGKGKLILQNKKVTIISLKKNKIYEIPEKTGHRLVNTGDKKLEVLTIYSKDSEPSYDIEFKKRLFKK